MIVSKWHLLDDGDGVIIVWFTYIILALLPRLFYVILRFPIEVSADEMFDIGPQPPAGEQISVDLHI